MLIQYTPISSLSIDQQSRLRTLGSSLSETTQPYVTFEGKYIAVSELQSWVRTMNARGPQLLQE